MKDYKTSSNSANVILALFVITLATASCTRIKQLIKPNAQSDKINEFNYSLPFGYKNAGPDDGPSSTSGLVILLPDQTRIQLGDLESQPIDLPTLGEKIKSFASGKSEYEKAVYIAARYDIDATVLNNVLNELRKHEINKVSLLISSTERRKDQYGNEGQYERSMGDIPAPDRVFEVSIRTNMYGDNLRPNPLLLLARLGRDRKLELNNQSFDDEDKLSSTLDEIFDTREANGVFRENTNEIEKTVLFQIDYDGNGSNTTHKYGDLIRVIDALKGAGASPIVLTDSGDPWGGPAITGNVSPHPLSGPATKEIPKTISGGVLNGKATNLPKPPYPPAARAVRASGAVNVQITVDENGNVIEAKAVSGHPLLRSAAEQAARSAKFAPTLLSGQRVKVSGILTYNFTDSP